MESIHENVSASIAHVNDMTEEQLQSIFHIKEELALVPQNLSLVTKVMTEIMDGQLLDMSTALKRTTCLANSLANALEDASEVRMYMSSNSITQGH